MKLRLDTRWVNRLLKAPESGMGYQRVDVTLADGRELKDAVVLNAEFLVVPDDLGPITIADLHLHRK